MHRRSLLTGAAAALGLHFLTLAPLTSAWANVRARTTRRVRPGDPQWPSAAAWNKLNADVGGNLIKTSPLLGACMQDATSAGCKDALQNLRNPLYIGDQAGGTQVSGWADAWEPAASAYAVAARNASDVVAAVNFARSNNLRLVVKGGGHSYQGTSNAPDSLLVWTRAMKGIVLHDAFVGQGCRGKMAAQPAVTGVITQVTLRTYDLPQSFGAAEGTVRARTDQAFRELILRMVGFYHDNLFNPHWGEQLAVGPDNTLHISMVCQGLDRSSVEEMWRPLFDHFKSNPDLSITGGLWAGTVPARHWWDAVDRKRRGSDSMIGDPRPGAPATHAWWSGDQEQVGALLYAFESAWLPGSLLEAGRRGRLANALFAASRHHKVELHINKGLAGASAEHIAAAADTAMNPEVLSAFALAIIADGGRGAYPGLPDARVDLAAARESRRVVTEAMRELRVVAPGPGAYVSESNYFEGAWERSFWGDHYARLAAVKARYDPEGLFFVHHGVGSEEWSADGFVRRGPGGR